MNSKRFQVNSYFILNILLYFIFILNYSSMSNNLSAIFIEKERLKWYILTRI